MNWFTRGRRQSTLRIRISLLFLTFALGLIWLAATKRDYTKIPALQGLGTREVRVHSPITHESIRSEKVESATMAPAQVSSLASVHFHQRVAEAPNWAVGYGKEFWHPTTSKSKSKIAQESKSGQGLDLDRVIQRVSNVFAEEGQLAVVKTTTYTAKFGSDGLEFTGGVATSEVEPVPAEKPPAGLFQTRAVLQGAELLYDRSKSSASSSVLGNTAQALLSEKSGIVEHYEALIEGVAVTWVLSKAPSGSQPLSIQARFSGLDYVGETSEGKHFAERGGVARIRIGNATAVDASGERWPLVTTVQGQTLEITVPETVLSQAAYPLAIDPIIGPEVGMDAPITVPASGDQLNPVVGSNGREYFVVWADRRSPISAPWWDLYGARVSAEGQVLDPSGILIARQPGQPVSIASNGHGYLVTWNFFNIWNYGIWGARISEDGVLLDARPAALVVNETGRAGTPSIASNGDNYLLTWSEASNVFGAIINSTGPLPTPSRLAICQRTAVGDSVAVASDGHDYFVTWTDSRSGTTGMSAIYGNKVSASGGTSEVNGFSVLQSSASVVNIALFFDRANYLSVWTGVNGSFYGTTLDLNGTALSTNSIPISSTSNGGSQFVWSSAGLSVIEANYEIIPPNSLSYSMTAALWTPNGGLQTPVILATNLPNPSVVARVENRYLLVNAEGTGGADLNLHARLRSADGTASAAKDFTVSTSGNGQHAPSVASNGSHYLVAWSDNRNPGSGSDIYAVRLDLEGKLIDPNAIAICAAAGDQVTPAVASNGSDYLINWIDKSGQLVANGVSSNGVISHPNGFIVGTALNPSIPSPHALASNGTNYLAVWVNYNGADTPSYHLTGAVIGGNNVVLKTIPDIVSRGIFQAPAVASNGKDYMMVWLDTRGAVPPAIFGARIADDGAVLDPSGFAVDSSTRWHFSPAIASNGSDYFAVWTDAAGPLMQASRAAGTKITADDQLSDAGPVTFSNGASPIAITAYGGDYAAGDYWLYWQQNDGLDAASKLFISTPLPQPVRGMRIDGSGRVSQTFSFDIQDYSPENPYPAEAPRMAYSRAGKFLIVSSSSASLARRIIGRTVSTLEPALYRDGKFTLTWQATVGKTYIVEYTSDILSGSWASMEGTVRATSEIASKTDDSAAGSQRRFYRVVEVQP